MSDWKEELLSEIEEMALTTVGIGLWVRNPEFDAETNTWGGETEEGSTKWNFSRDKLIDVCKDIALNRAVGGKRIMGEEYETAIAETYRAHVRGMREDCEFDIDSECADIVWQIAAFGDIVYG
jgi:hypothetical protein